MSKVTFKINGRTVTANSNEMVLEVARKHEIDIPTLCQHDAVESAGACRVCLVDVTHPNWNGWSSLVTSCVYPVDYYCLYLF